MIIVPVWSITKWLQKLSGEILVGTVRPGKDYLHKAPALISHLKTHNIEDALVFLGRRNSQFHKNWVRADFSNDMKPH